MTIFGFNTDVKLGEVMYHVQSEARQGDMLLQTMVFVKGQCVGKRAVSYAQKSGEPGFSEQAMHELLKAQHRAVLEDIQQGRIESVLGSDRGIQDVGEGGLTLRWINSAEQPRGSSFSMSFQVLDGEDRVSGAEIAVSANSPGAPPLATATTDAAGGATLDILLTDEVLQDSAVIARASHAGKSATRKFRFRKQTQSQT
jgi:hypothetical protein